VLASDILCQRHNSALSSLDAQASHVSKTILRFDRSLLKYDGSTTPREYVDVSGVDFERWLLKCIVGLVLSGNLKHSVLKDECVNLLYSRLAWPELWGLYFSLPAAGTAVYHSDSFIIESLTDAAT